MKSKKVKAFTAVSLTVLLMATMTYAASSNQLSYVEKFETDKVEINLQGLTVTEDGETEATGEIVEANKDVSYIPRIENEGADCYIRAKVEVVMDGECEEPLSIENIYGMGADWVLKGDYFYHTEVLRDGEQVDVFEGIHIPKDWEYGEADSFSVNVTAEAIQSANFTTDFSDELPWGAVSLQSAAVADGLTVMEAVPVSHVSDAEFTSDGGFQCNSSELFDEFSGMMPGDCYEKTVNLKNTSDNPMHVTLKVTSGDNELNRKINIKIKAGDREIYTGTAYEVNQLEAVDLLKLAEGNTGSVTLQMHLPADVDNDYTEMEDDIVWELSVEEIVDDAPQTGDDFNMMLMLLICLTAMMVLIALMLYGRRGGYETTR